VNSPFENNPFLENPQRNCSSSLPSTIYTNARLIPTSRPKKIVRIRLGSSVSRGSPQQKHKSGSLWPSSNTYGRHPSAAPHRRCVFFPGNVRDIWLHIPSGHGCEPWGSHLVDNGGWLSFSSPSDLLLPLVSTSQFWTFPDQAGILRAFPYPTHRDVAMKIVYQHSTFLILLVFLIFIGFFFER
jgi:hypothetical protein